MVVEEKYSNLGRLYSQNRRFMGADRAQKLATLQLVY